MKKTIAVSSLIALAVGTTAFAQGRGFGFHGQFFEHLDANADGKITREELRAEVQRRFADFDLDKNGKVDASEMKRAGDAKFSQMQARRAEHLLERDENHDGKWSKSELSRMPERLFTKLDQDGNGVLTRDELDPGRDLWTERHGDFLQHVWSRVDSNGDGVVDGQEALRAAEARFEGIDANHDGAVTRDEWKVKGHHGCDHDHGPGAPGAAAGAHG